MHPKVKSTVSGLLVVAAFVLGSALVGEPLATPGRTAQDGLALPDPHASLALDEALGLESGAEARARAGNRRRLHLTMPYVASRIGTVRLLPQGGES